uniref:Uncharacterized protein n=1 Tax=Panagrolaimus davidi TaxID=227884 RepID=A0A914QE41_9BILA
MFTNAFLLYSIKYKSDKGMEAYKKVLYLGTGFDFFSAFWCFFFQPDMGHEGYLFIAVNRTILGYLPSPWTIWVFQIFLFNDYFALVHPLIQFIYRYLLVCWKITLNKWQFFVIILLGAAIVAAYPGNLIFDYLIKRTESDNDYKHFFKGTEWDLNGTIPDIGVIPLVSQALKIHWLSKVSDIDVYW